LEYQCHKWPRICSLCRNHNPVLSSFISYQRMFDTTYATAYLSEFTPGLWFCVARCLVFCVVYYRSLFVFLCFFLWSLFCLSFCELRLLITSLVSSNFFVVFRNVLDLLCDFYISVLYSVWTNVYNFSLLTFVCVVICINIIKP
jgi:hypothetical protein